MNKKITVFCTTEFEGWHRWAGAPPELSYLSNCHRHMFKVKVSVTVRELDRQIEFIQLKGFVNSLISDGWLEVGTKDQPVGSSCEMFADLIAGVVFSNFAGNVSVEVNEDGENGAVVVLEETPE